ncbi:hypothetical protein HYH02_007887 [Chlamydomonas schloesseri]|uniref:Uncharacterized protein n=1 Tax=Chlamydomonas schloesseri TaxID=2026947 RepID=A0A836B444_9CHLO|nr:hypothetical protein HYH02_007887 [Chlamydomonas schloesseri]|eukprot:KAG2447141.1 hypothetical protein HYH02_007887 [Chlamydomonas schloesseri]
MDKRWHQVLSYLYVATCVVVILANANAVLVASATYSLSSVMPERRFVEWLVRKTQNGLGRNVSVWVQAGAFCMVLCIVLAATLLHGWPMGVLAAGVSLLLYVLGQISVMSIAHSYWSMSRDEGPPGGLKAAGP